MESWLDTYTRHVPEHIAQMEAIFQSWVRQPGGAAARDG